MRERREGEREREKREGVTERVRREREKKGVRREGEKEEKQDRERGGHNAECHERSYLRVCPGA